MFKFNESMKDYLNDFCLSWEDISWAYEKGLIDISFIEYYTNKNLEDEISIEMYLSFNANEIFEIIQKLHKVFVGLDCNVKESIKRYWLYLILKYLYINKGSYDDVYSTIDEVYADFDYPETIESFIRYMPIRPDETEDIDKRITGTARLQKYWERYLDDFENSHSDIFKQV